MLGGDLSVCLEYARPTQNKAADRGRGGGATSLNHMCEPNRVTLTHDEHFYSQESAGLLADLANRPNIRSENQIRSDQSVPSLRSSCTSTPAAVSAKRMVSTVLFHTPCTIIGVRRLRLRT